MTLQILDAGLREDFGFEHILWCSLGDEASTVGCVMKGEAPVLTYPCSMSAEMYDLLALV